MTELFYKKFDNYIVRECFDHSILPEPVETEDIFGMCYPIKMYVPSNGEFKVKRLYHGKEVFDENKKNLLFSLFHRRITVVVARNEEKVTLKYFLFQNNRRVGEKFYRIATCMRFITYNIKKNLIYYGTLEGYHKKRKFKKTIKCYRFDNNLLAGAINGINSWYEHVFDTSPLNRINLRLGQDAVECFIKEITNSTEPTALDKFVLEKKGLKLSDNWNVFCGEYPQPKAKDYKKFGNKYLDAIMGIHKLNGDKIKRVLHKVKKFDISSFYTATQFFGRDFIISQDDNFIVKLFESNLDGYRLQYQKINSKKELNNIFEIFKLVLDKQIDINTMSDHLNFYYTLRRFVEIKWKSRTYDEFREEHLDWTELNQFYTRGTFARVYSEMFKNEIQKPIVNGDKTYYPVLLLDSREYNDESFVQSNCVKGYIKRPDCFIISLRSESSDSKERATIEFRIGSKKGKLNLKRTQTLGRFNKQLPVEWDSVIDSLDTKVDECTKYFELPKLKCKIGHTEFESTSSFEESKNKNVSYGIVISLNDGEYLKWDDDRVENINTVEEIRLINELNNLEF